MIEDFDKINPETIFTPERRRIEYKLMREFRKAISEMNISQEEKEFMRKESWNYLIEYEQLYARYERERKTAKYKFFSLVN